MFVVDRLIPPAEPGPSPPLPALIGPTKSDAGYEVTTYTPVAPPPKAPPPPPPARASRKARG